MSRCFHVHLPRTHNLWRKHTDSCLLKRRCLWLLNRLNAFGSYNERILHSGKDFRFLRLRNILSLCRLSFLLQRKESRLLIKRCSLFNEHSPVVAFAIQCGHVTIIEYMPSLPILWVLYVHILQHAFFQGVERQLHSPDIPLTIFFGPHVLWYSSLFNRLLQLFGITAPNRRPSMNLWVRPNKLVPETRVVWLTLQARILNVAARHHRRLFRSVSGSTGERRRSDHGHDLQVVRSHIHVHILNIRKFCVNIHHKRIQIEKHVVVAGNTSAPRTHVGSRKISL